MVVKVLGTQGTVSTASLSISLNVHQPNIWLLNTGLLVVKIMLRHGGYKDEKFALCIDIKLASY